MAVLGLTVVQLAFFIYELTLSAAAKESFVLDFALIPYELARNVNVPLSHHLPPYVNLVTAFFLSGGFLPLAVSLIYLWIFGRDLERFLGAPRLVLFYLLTGIVALTVQMQLDPDSLVPLVGSLAPTAAILGAFLVLRPRAPWWQRALVVVFFGLCWSGLLHPGYPGAAFSSWVGQLAGFAAGLLIALFHPKRKAAHG